MNTHFSGQGEKIFEGVLCKKHSWGKKSSLEDQQQILSSLYIMYGKYTAGCIHTVIEVLGLHKACGHSLDKHYGVHDFVNNVFTLIWN